MGEDGPGNVTQLRPKCRARRRTVAVGRQIDWGLRVNKNGAAVADEANVLLALEKAQELNAVARWDDFAQQLLLADGATLGLAGAPRPWQDSDTTALQTYIQQAAIPRIGREKIDSALLLHARGSFSFHPVREYLRALAWDGVPRLGSFPVTHLGATLGRQPQTYVTSAFTAWAISAVARIEQPGCQADYVVVLEGGQGVRKSSAMRLLASDAWFSDSLPHDLGHKDAAAHLHGKWLIELPELAQFRRSEIETVKAYITRRIEKFRPSYGRHEIAFPRQCIFVGSTNAQEYLVDDTGNRRFWPINCGQVDLDAIARDRDQLWAEAVTLYQSGAIWYLPPEIEALAATETATRVSCDPWHKMVADALAILPPHQVEVSPGEILEKMDIQKEQRHAKNAARVGAILRALGWNRGRRDMTRGQLYARPAMKHEADEANFHATLENTDF